MLDGKAAYGLAAYRDGRLCAMAVGCFEIYCGKNRIQSAGVLRGQEP